MRHIPNSITLSNLLCGCLATYFALQYELTTASFLILAGAILDFFDGFAARALKVNGELGKQLDSLADVITFGMAPACICFSLLAIAPTDTGQPVLNYILRFFPFIMVAFSAYRLAKFNIDERQTSSFIGLPTPANALLWLSFPLILTYSPESDAANWLTSGMHFLLQQNYILLALVIIMSYLLVAELELFALKFKPGGFRHNAFQWLFLALSLLLLLIFSFVAVPFILILYLVLSLIKNYSKTP